MVNDPVAEVEKLLEGYKNKTKIVNRIARKYLHKQ